jgi:hypothetical protein
MKRWIFNIVKAAALRTAVLPAAWVAVTKAASA